MTADILGGRMNHQVSSKPQRLLKKWRRESVIDNAKRAMPMRDLRGCADIRDAQQWVGRRLNPEQASTPGDRALDLPHVGGLDERKSQAETFKHTTENSIGTAINVLGGDDVVPLLQEEQNSRRRAHARGKRQAIVRRLKACQRFLQRGSRGIVSSRIIITFVDARRALRERAGLIDRRRDGSRRRLRLLSGVNSASGKTHCLVIVLPARHWMLLTCSMTSNRVKIPP